MILSPWLAGFFSAVLFVSQASGVAVRIETSSGEVLTGQWGGVTDTFVRLEDSTAAREIPLDQIVALRPEPPLDASTGPPMHVTLIDGSSVYAEDIGIDDTRIKIEPRRQSSFTLPIPQIRSIRFRRGGPTTDPQWLGLVEKVSRTDMMVIRRGNEQLDPIGGVVVGLNRETLEFELDGDKITAPLERLEGVLFRSADSDAPVAKVKVDDIYGSTYLTARLEPSDSSDSVEIRLAGQVKHSIPMAQVKAITWASGRVMLAAEPPASSELATFLPASLPPGLAKAWFGPIGDGEDIIATAGGKIDYRVADGFETLAGSVGRDGPVVAGGVVKIRVLVDDQVKWEQTLSDSMAKGFRIPVVGARRVRLEVLAGDDGDVGDQVRFSKPRLLK
jgi:hypothetical protein